jgi:enolase
LKGRGLATSVGDEGGFAPNFGNKARIKGTSMILCVLVD